MPPVQVISLVVGPQKTRIKTSATALRLASSVFDKMLEPNLSEGKQEEIELPEDDDETMQLLVEMSEHQGGPEIASSELAWRLAILMDKYDASPIRQYLKFQLKLRCKRPFSTRAERLQWVRTALTVDEPELFATVFAWALNYHDDNTDETHADIDSQDALLLGLLNSRVKDVKYRLYTYATDQLKSSSRMANVPQAALVEFLFELNQMVEAAPFLHNLACSLRREYSGFTLVLPRMAIESFEMRKGKDAFTTIMMVLMMALENCYEATLCVDCVKTYLDGEKRKCRLSDTKSIIRYGPYLHMPFHLRGKAADAQDDVEGSESEESGEDEDDGI